MSTSLSEQNEIIEDAGDVGGDIQVGPAFNRRFTDGVGTLVDVYVYVCRENATYTLDASPKPWIQVQWSYLECTDLADPGGTETYADYRFVDERNDPATNEQARVICRAFTAEDFENMREEMTP